VEPEDREIEELLRRSRPAPSAEWVSRTQSSLLPERQPLWRLPAVRVGSALAGGLAALLLVLALAGVDLGGGDRDVRAVPDCPLVTVERTERLPVLVTGPHGRVHVERRKQQVKRSVRRCPQR
jgi:hypothetical protein